MYYLIVGHIGDEDDCDLFSFDSLERAIKYIKDEDLIDWELSDMVSGGPEEYTKIDKEE